MSDFISREYLLAEYDRQHQGPPGGARKIIAEAPAADVVEVRHGRWVDEEYVWQGLKSARCNQCKRKTDYYIQPKYCPNCGAKMDGGQDDV